jgi:GntR family transcriptional regulator/MocR family aminotransferase
VQEFPRGSWLRSIKTVMAQTPNEHFGYLDGRGAPQLREALAAYLNRVRGTSAHPDQVVITNGYAQGIGLVIQVLARQGAVRLAVEDPSDNDVPPLARMAGLDLVGIPVDEHGIRADLLEEVAADAVILTAAHQWPTGGVLSPEARAGVLRWAHRRGAVVVEDDYDAEFRYDRAPIGALQGLAPDRVVYAGSASKTVAPGLRLGWLVLPPPLAETVAATKYAADRGSPILDQLTFADFLTRGEFDRHLRRMRPIYRRRRDTLVAALGRHLPGFEPAGISAGLHLVTWLPDDLDEDAVVEAAARRGVGVYGVRPFRLSPGGRGGVIFGYSNLPERALAEGVSLLADAVADVRS